MEGWKELAAWWRMLWKAVAEAPPCGYAMFYGRAGYVLDTRAAPPPEAYGVALEENTARLNALPAPRRTPPPEGSSRIALEKLLDVRRALQWRAILQGAAHRIELWELLCFVATGGYDARRMMERHLRQWESGDALGYTDGALDLFQKLLGVRQKHGSFVRRLRAYLSPLMADAFGTDAVEIALGLLVSAPKGRERALRWLCEPEASRLEAAEYMKATVELARDCQPSEGVLNKSA